MRPLFGATDQTPTPELMEMIQRNEPERLGRVNAAVGRDLEAIVHKCLEKSADARYATAGELAADLDRWLAGEPVRARPCTAGSGRPNGRSGDRSSPDSASLSCSRFSGP